MRILLIGVALGMLARSCVELARSCVALVIPAPCREVCPLASAGRPFASPGIAAPGPWGHHSPLPQYRLAKTGTASAKRRARKARFWQGDGHGRP